MIDNSNHTTTSETIEFSISTNDGQPFKLHSFWGYPAHEWTIPVGTGGTFKIEGKLAGISQFMATSSSGFNT